jgi:hypothetical protein
VILSNQAKCLLCGDVIHSAHRHDFRTCSCRNVSVDGGMDYIRRVYDDVEGIEEQSIEIPDAAYTACLEAIKWSKDTGRNDLGLVSAIARAMRDNGVKFSVAS